MCSRMWANDRLGIPVVPGSIIWHAMKVGSVQAYVDANPIGPRTDAGELLESCRFEANWQLRRLCRLGGRKYQKQQHLW
jgi:hypothetical protein